MSFIFTSSFCIKLLGEVRSTLKGVLDKNFYVDTFPDFIAAISVHRKSDDFSQVRKIVILAKV